MSDFLTFEGRIETIGMGRATYTLLRVPEEVEHALGPAKRVEGEIAEHPVNLALSRTAGVEGAFLWTGQSLLDRIGVAPGEVVEVRLRPAPDDGVDLPDDVAGALARAGLTALWEGLSPGKRRGLLYRIAAARTAATRDKRIAALVADLSD